jgi:hypothetical protein
VVGKSCRVTVQYSPSAAGASDSGQLNATNSKKKGATTASLALAGAGATRHLYWTNYGDYGRIARANIDGTGVNPFFAFAH